MFKSKKTNKTHPKQNEKENTDLYLIERKASIFCPYDPNKEIIRLTPQVIPEQIGIKETPNTFAMCAPYEDDKPKIKATITKQETQSKDFDKKKKTLKRIFGF